MSSEGNTNGEKVDIYILVYKSQYNTFGFNNRTNNMIILNIILQQDVTTD